MRYFRAIELDEKPFIQFDCWATNDEDYITLGLDQDALVVAEDNLPEYRFGVCTQKIENGQLVERTETELLAFEAEYETTSRADRYAGTIDNVDKGVFEFNRERFPLHQSARLMYEVAERNQTDMEFQTIDGKRILIETKDIAAFAGTYRNEIKNIITAKS